MLHRLQTYLDDSKILPKHSRLVVAVSGGVDSVVLLDLLARLSSVWEWRLVVAHVDHKTRPSSADDAVFVSKVADKYGLGFRLGQLNPRNLGEAELRRGRYDFLQSVCNGEKADYIVTAHHGDDRIETAIFNAIRGTSHRGLIALKPTRGQIVRPFLDFSKADLTTYALINNLDYREDPTNLNPSYHRNVLRHHVLPWTTVDDAHFRTNFVSKLDALEKLNTKIDYGLERLADTICDTIGQDKIVLNRTSYLKLPPIVGLNLLVYLIKIIDPAISLSDANIKTLLNFIQSAKTGSHRHLNTRLKIIRSYDTLVISAEPIKTTSGAPATRLLRLGNSLDFGDFRLSLSLVQDKNKDEFAIQQSGVYVRHWQPGDRIYPIGMKGSRKLQDIFVDAKVPRQLRQSWPVVVNRSNEVIMVPTLANDRRFAVNTKHAYILSAQRLERAI